MYLANSFVYGHRLKCGTVEVSRSRLDLPQEEKLLLPIDPEAQDWIREVLRPSRSVIFLDTDHLIAVEDKTGLAITNPIESALLYLLSASLVRCGIPASKIGVVAPFRAQLHFMTHTWADSFTGLDLSTIDCYQGMDNDCILACFCCSNQERDVAKILMDPRRCNVAFTRAKKKLILVGSVRTLSSSPPFERLFTILRSKDWLFSLPPNAHQVYPLPSLSLSNAISSQSSLNRNESKKRLREIRSFPSRRGKESQRISLTTNILCELDSPSEADK